MTLLNRVALSISKHTHCVRAFPCKDCDTVRDEFSGSGCRVLATAALSAMMPIPSLHRDDDVRAAKVEEEMCGDVTAHLVLEVIERWIEEALLEDGS